MPSAEIVLRGFSASSNSPSGTRASVPSTSVGVRVVTSKSAGVGDRVGEGFGMEWLLFCEARVVARGGWGSGPPLGERSAGDVRADAGWLRRRAGGGGGPGRRSGA